MSLAASATHVRDRAAGTVTGARLSGVGGLLVLGGAVAFVMHVVLSPPHGAHSRRDVVRIATIIGPGTSAIATLLGACDRLLDATRSQKRLP
jgi:hypothetical protein